MMSLIVTVICEGCGRRNTLERVVTEPGTIKLICGGCESPIRAVIREGGDTKGKTLNMSFSGHRR